MRLAFISDTHEQHGATTQALIAAKADVVVHCGDFTGKGDPAKIEAFGEWCAMLVRKGYTRHVVAIAGNHELTLDPASPLTSACTAMLLRPLWNRRTSTVPL